MEQEKEANPIAEIFDEMFILLEDLERRNVAVLEYLKEQGGVSDEKLAPYFSRAAAASDVRWRAARARMEHLLAPKPKSTTEARVDGKAKGGPGPQTTENETQGGETKAKGQEEKEQKAKPESTGLGKELASAQPGVEKSGEPKDDKEKAPNTATDAKSKDKELRDRKQDKEPAASNQADAQASTPDGKKKSDSLNLDTSTKSTAQWDGKNTKSQAAVTQKPQTQKAAK